MSTKTFTSGPARHDVQSPSTPKATHDATRATNETRVVLIVVAVFLVYVTFVVHYLNVVYLNS